MNSCITGVACEILPADSVFSIGQMRVETRDGLQDVSAGQAGAMPHGHWLRYRTPGTGGAEYVAVCLPAFSPETVHRDAH